jgi:tRNA nucleotidyltransferase (CCA-adding enzyme)
MIGKYWEHFTHDAGVGVRGIGATIEEAFEQTAIALTTAITDPKDAVSLEQVEIECEAPDDELLLTEWLNALVYQMTTKSMLFSHFDVKIHGNQLHAAVLGEGADRDRHKPAVEVKSATHWNLRVRQDETGTWLAQCVIAV